MAWSIHNGIKKLVVSIDGGEAESIDNIQSAPFYPGTPQSGGAYFLFNDAYTTNNMTVTGYNNEGDAPLIRYNAIVALESGTLSLLTILANAISAKIWNPKVGDGTYLEIRKTIEDQRYQIKLISGNATLATIYAEYGSYTFRRCGIGFMHDSDRNMWAMYCNMVTNAWSSGHAITQYTLNVPTSSPSRQAEVSAALAVLLDGNVIYPDPYEDGGYSTSTEQGTGTFDDTSEAIADPSTPSLSPSIGNFVNQYVVSATALSNFGAWLYSGGSIFDDLAKLFQSPMEAIINVGILPYSPDYNPDAYVDIKVGGLNSNVQANLITKNYKIVDMGTLEFDPFYGSALDYNPYTKCSIYLPYCGTFPLNVDEIMGHTISLKYYCDSLSGDCVAVLSDEERVLEQFRGNVFIQVPITARDFSTVYANALSSAVALAAGIASVAATGGISAPAAVGIGSSMAANAMNSKTHYSRSGGFSGVAGLMSVQTPYVILTVPRQCLPEKQNSHQGYPLFVTKRLGDFSGFTKVYEIHLDGLDCTDAEAKEIYDLLKGGVII